MSKAIAVAPPSNANVARAARRSARQSRPMLDCRAATNNPTAEPGFGRRDDWRLGLADRHIQPHLAPAHRDRQTPASFRRRDAARFAISVGLRPPCVANPAMLSHPDCRAFLTLIAAHHTEVSAPADRRTLRCRRYSRPHLTDSAAAPDRDKRRCHAIAGSVRDADLGDAVWRG